MAPNLLHHYLVAAHLAEHFPVVEASPRRLEHPRPDRLVTTDWLRQGCSAGQSSCIDEKVQ